MHLDGFGFKTDRLFHLDNRSELDKCSFILLWH